MLRLKEDPYLRRLFGKPPIPVLIMGPDNAALVSRYGAPAVAAQVERIQQHLRRVDKALDTAARPRVFLAYRQVNWEEHGLLQPWQEVADVVAWNFGGINDRFDSDWHRGPKAAFNAELLKRAYAAQAEQKIDIFFGYLSGRQVTAEQFTQLASWGSSPSTSA
ncbi:MAG: hypothetical protein R2856_21990 [Caldilineaceae bacterium]